MLKRNLLPLLVLTLLAACGKSEQPAESSAAPQAQAAAPVPAAAPSPASDPHLAQGEKVYKGTCVMCHGSGAGGAPLFKSKQDWAPRIAQGKETLYQHALAGFQGKVGVMPPKGGNVSLSDDDVKAGVDYMVSMAQ